SVCIDCSNNLWVSLCKASPLGLFEATVATIFGLFAHTKGKEVQNYLRLGSFSICYLLTTVPSS
ncbi:hypothetical protein LEMLEM_LOCUS8891, partial [Lemmus lemmus]